MKNQMLLIVAVFAATLLVSCRKNAEEIVALLSENEAAEIVETAVAERSAGAAMPAVDVTTLVESWLENCGVPGDTTLQRTKTTGPVTYNYTFDMDWLIQCNNLNIPTAATVNVAGNGSFSTQRWTGSDAAIGDLNITGLNPQAPDYIVNGSYTLEGDVTGSFRNVNPTLDCTTTLHLNNLSIRKSDRLITGGTGTATVVVTNGKGQTETLNGTLVFNGDGTVTITVNGHTHTFPI